MRGHEGQAMKRETIISSETDMFSLKERISSSKK
jgi:hypothetical protein